MITKNIFNFYNILNIFLISFTSIPFVAEANIFGPNTYEECMSDGKVGRTDNELYLLENKCLKLFPKLPKTFAMKNSTVLCVGNSEGVNNDMDIYKIVGNFILVESGKKYKINIRTPETLVVNANWVKENNTKKILPETVKKSV